MPDGTVADYDGNGDGREVDLMLNSVSLGVDVLVGCSCVTVYLVLLGGMSVEGYTTNGAYDTEDLVISTHAGGNTIHSGNTEIEGSAAADGDTSAGDVTG